MCELESGTILNVAYDMREPHPVGPGECPAVWAVLDGNGAPVLGINAARYTDEARERAMAYGTWSDAMRGSNGEDLGVRDALLQQVGAAVNRRDDEAAQASLQVYFDWVEEYQGPDEYRITARHRELVNDGARIAVRSLQVVGGSQRCMLVLESAWGRCLAYVGWYQP